MAKVCDTCGGKHYAKGKCKIHYVFPSKQNAHPIKKKKYKINIFSDKKVAELALYRKQRDKYFKLHPVCQFPNCTSNQITLHHSRGRCGSLLTDIRYFKSLCWEHHNWVEENVSLALEMGLTLKRLNK